MEEETRDEIIDIVNNEEYLKEEPFEEKFKKKLSLRPKEHPEPNRNK